MFAGLIQQIVLLELGIQSLFFFFPCFIGSGRELPFLDCEKDLV